MAVEAKQIDFHSLIELGKAISSERELQRIMDVLLFTLMGRMLITKSAVVLREGGDRYRFKAVKGLHHSILQKTLNGQMHLQTITRVDEVIESVWRDELKRLGLSLLVPIQHKSNTLGYIVLGPKTTRQAFSDAELAYLEAMANLAAPIIDNSNFMQQITSLNRQLDKKIQELQTLFEIANEINSTLDLKTIANTLAFSIMGEMLVQHCIILLKQDSGAFQVLAHKGYTNLRDIPLVRKRKTLHVLFQFRSIQFVHRIPSKPLRETLHQSHIEVCLPMISQDEVKGLILLGPRLNNLQYGESEIQFLNTLANTAIISFENARLFHEALIKQRILEELEIARDIQKRLLPARPPDIPGFDIAGLNVPTHQVGGDYFDFIPMQDHKIAIAIGDVAGKGVPASLLMSNLQAGLQALIQTGMPLHHMVQKLNNMIYKNTSSDKFITFFIAVLDYQKRRLTYVNAGHNPPLWISGHRRVRQLNQGGGLLLGIFPDMRYDEVTIELSPGDWLILYTDGVSEAMNPKDEEYGVERLERAVCRNLECSAETMIQKIVKSVLRFSRNTPQSDDITLVAVHVL